MRALASAESTTSSEYMATQFFKKKKPAKIFDEVGQRSRERLFAGFTEDSAEKAALSAGQSGIGVKRSADRPAHLGDLIADKLRILDMIRCAATARLLPEPLSARLDTPVEAASAVFRALDDSEKPTARLCKQYTHLARCLTQSLFVRVAHGLTRLKCLCCSTSVRVIVKIIFTSLACHVPHASWSTIHGTFTEHVDFLFTAVPFKLHSNYNFAVCPICRTIPSHRL